MGCAFAASADHKPIASSKLLVAADRARPRASGGRSEPSIPRGGIDQRDAEALGRELGERQRQGAAGEAAAGDDHIESAGSFSPLVFDFSVTAMLPL